MYNIHMPVVEQRLLLDSKYVAFNFIKISLSMNRRIRNPHKYLESSSAFHNNMVDQYADRSNLWKQHKDGLFFTQMNFETFVRTYTVTSKGELSRYSCVERNILVLYPEVYPNQYDPEKMALYCTTQLFRYRPYQGEIINIFDNKIEPQKCIQEYVTFLETDYAKSHLTSFARDQQSLGTILRKLSADEDKYADESVIPGQPDWACFNSATINQEDDDLQFESDDNISNYDWTNQGHKFGTNVVARWRTWFKDHTEIQHEHPEWKSDKKKAAKKENLYKAQEIAYTIVENYLRKFKAAVKIGQEIKTLRMIIMGSAGSDKSYLVFCLKQVLGDLVQVEANTGVAARNVNGRTECSALLLALPNVKKRS